MQNKLGATIRGVVVVLMGATTVVTLLGAIGTVCLAWSPERYGTLGAAYIPQMPTYQMLVYVKLVLAVAMAAVTYATVRAYKWFYVGALVVLLIGISAAAVQMYTSSVQRKIAFLAVAPTNIRFYLTLVTLMVFAIIRFPGIWNKSGLGNPRSKPGSPMAAGGVTLMVAGLLILTVPIWAGPTHMLDGYNLVYALEAPLLVDGGALVLGGAILIMSRRQLTALLQKKPKDRVGLRHHGLALAQTSTKRNPTS